MSQFVLQNNTTAGGITVDTEPTEGSNFLISSGGVYNAIQGGGGGSDAFEVKFTVEYDEQSSAYIAASDKTYSEINAAYTANKNIYAWLYSAGNPTLLTTGYNRTESGFIFYFNDKNDPGYYARWQVTVETESITVLISYEVEPIYISGDYSSGSILDASSLEMYNVALLNGAPVYINIAAGSDGVYPFIINPLDATGYCFAGPASVIGYTAVIDDTTGEITVTSPNS